MKSIVESIQQIDEAREISYRVQLNGTEDETGIPVTVTLVVAKSDQREVEKWIMDQEDEAIMHAEGGNIEY